MTQPAQQPEHCDHEPVCSICSKYTYKERTPCEFDFCKFDTRSRPHTSTPEFNPGKHFTYKITEQQIRLIEVYLNDENNKPKYPSFTNSLRIHPFDDTTKDDLDTCVHCHYETSIKEHDAAIRNATLDDVIKYYSDLPEHEASCPFGEMNESDDCQKYQHCELCIMMRCIKSLHNKQEKS